MQLNRSIISDEAALELFQSDMSTLGSLETQYDPIPRLDQPESLTLSYSDNEFLKWVHDTQDFGYRKPVDVGIGKLGIKGVAHLNYWQTRFPVGGDPRSILKKFVGHKEDPAMLLYPLINKISGREKIELQITLVIEFRKPILTGAEQIQEIRKLHESLISDYWEKCLEEPRKLFGEFEEQPGKILSGAKITSCPEYRKLSVEYGLVQQALQALVNNNILTESSPLSDRKFYEDAFTLFKRDVLHMGLEGKDPAVRELRDDSGKGLGLYLPMDEHQMFPHDEIKYIYRVCADALESYARQVAKNLANPQRQGAKPYQQFQEAFKSFDDEHPAIPGNKQNKDRIRALLGIVSAQFEKFKMDNKNKAVILEVKELIKAVYALLREMDMEAIKKAEIAITAKYAELKSKMLAQKSKSRSKLLVLDPQTIFSEEEKNQEIFNKPEKLEAHSLAVIDRLLADKDLCGCLLPLDNLYYIGYFNLLHKIKADTQKTKDSLQIKAVEMIEANAPETHPGRNPKKELAALSSNLAFQAELDLKSAELDEARVRARLDEKPVLIRLLELIGRFFKWLAGDSPGNLSHQNREGSGIQRVSSAANMAQLEKARKEKEEEEFKYRFAEVSLKYVYPDKFKTIEDKIYNDHKMGKAIQEVLFRIKSEIPELKKDSDEKIAGNVKRVALLNSTTIAVPDNLIPLSGRVVKEGEPEKYPRNVYFPRKDFNTPYFREQLKELYWGLAEKNRFNEPAKNYYLYIYNEINENYLKYLRRRGMR